MWGLPLLGYARRSLLLQSRQAPRDFLGRKLQVGSVGLCEVLADPGVKALPYWFGTCKAEVRTGVRVEGLRVLLGRRCKPQAHMLFFFRVEGFLSPKFSTTNSFDALSRGVGGSRAFLRCSASISPRHACAPIASLM